MRCLRSQLELEFHEGKADDGKGPCQLVRIEILLLSADSKLGILGLTRWKRGSRSDSRETASVYGNEGAYCTKERGLVQRALLVLIFFSKCCPHRTFHKRNEQALCNSMSIVAEPVGSGF